MLRKLLKSTENKMNCVDARIALIEVLHREFQALCHSLEFSQDQKGTLTKDNKALQHSVNTVSAQFTSVIADNKTMKENILDLQACSMTDNLVFSGIL